MWLPHFGHKLSYPEPRRILHHALFAHLIWCQASTSTWLALSFRCDDLKAAAAMHVKRPGRIEVLAATATLVSISGQIHSFFRFCVNGGFRIPEKIDLRHPGKCKTADFLSNTC